MGLLQRLFGGASEPNESEHSSERLSGRAGQPSSDLVAELRALKAEIKALRESLAKPVGGQRAAAATPGTGSLSVSDPSSSSDASNGAEGAPRRRRRGGRGRGDRASDGGAPRSRGERSSDFFEDDGEAIATRQVRTPRPPPEDAPTGPLVDFLKERGILVYEGQDDLNRNEAFEHLARHLGTHFDLLAPFYEKTKRLVASGRGSKFEIEHFNDAERSAAVQFGTLLHRHGMLKDFYYHRSPKKALRVIPTKDGKTGQFLTGGWLEIFVSMLLSKRLRAHLSPAKYQMLYNVKGALPDGREFEADIMAVVEGRMFWLECKTGNWQDYSARFRGLVPTFGVDRNSSGLLLLRAPDASTRSRATDMLDMTVMSLQEVDGFLCRFLGVEPGGEPLLAGMASESGESVDDPYSTVALESGEPRSESDESDLADADGEPLENLPPARKLGRVALPGRAAAAATGGEDGEGEGASAEGEGGKRRRRRRPRRRGGASRGAADGGAAAASGRLLEPLQIFGDEGAEAAADAADADVDEPVSAASASTADAASGAAEAEAAPRKRRRRGGRGRRGGARPSPFAEEGAAEPATESAEIEEEEAVEATRSEPEQPQPPEPEPVPARAAPGEPPPAPLPAKPPAAPQPKIGATGATIAPDWRKMVAGAPKKTDGAA